MIIHIPTEVTYDMLVARPGPDIGGTDGTQWDNNTSYNADDRVYSFTNHTTYQAVQSSFNVDPVTDTDNSHWVRVGPVNYMRPFDNSVSTQCVSEADITYRIAVPANVKVTSVSFFNVECTEIDVDISTTGTSTLKFSETFSIADTSVISDLNDYYTSPPNFRSEFVVRGFEAVEDDFVDVTFRGLGGGGAGAQSTTRKVGAIVLGRSVQLGVTGEGTAPNIEDFSLVEQDPFGNVTVVDRGFRKTVKFRFAFDSDRGRELINLFSQIRGTYCVFEGGDGTDQFGTVVYGIYESFDIPITTTMSIGTLTVSGSN